MTWMNTHEIAEATAMFQHDDVLGPATMSLVNLAAWANQNSDGWHSWPKPGNAASKLMDLIQRGVLADRTGNEHGITHADVRRALAPIKAFRTRMVKAGKDADFDLFERFSVPTTTAAERTIDPHVKDWWVDGHYVAAPNEQEARTEAARLYAYEPVTVRPWTDDDQRALDEQDGAPVTYSLAEVRNGTGWPEGARFALVTEGD